MNTPPKTNIEPQNEPPEEEIPTKNPSFSGSMLVFRGGMSEISPQLRFRQFASNNASLVGYDVKWTHWTNKWSHVAYWMYMYEYTHVNIYVGTYMIIYIYHCIYIYVNNMVITHIHMYVWIRMYERVHVYVCLKVYVDIYSID